MGAIGGLTTKRGVTMAYRWLAALVLCVALARERAGAASAIGRYFGGLGLVIMAATTPIVLLVSRLFYRHCEAPWVRRSNA